MTPSARESWRDLPRGGLVTVPGSAARHATGAWRVERPEIDLARCTHCMICWMLCPDSCFGTREGKLLGVDLDHCKGCGICALECPRKCIAMVPESKGG